MKKIIFILIFGSVSTILGQTVAKTINGIVVDSSTKNPINGAKIWVNLKIVTTADSSGHFKYAVTKDSFLLMVTAKNYVKKYIRDYNLNEPMTVQLVPYDLEKEFIISGKPLDTAYFKNKKISKINFQFKDEITFYPSGQMKSKTVRGSYREWYENGKLKEQSISQTPHNRHETSWYNNGQMKECGSTYWTYNAKIKSGDWFKSTDYKYWTEDGKEIKPK